MTCPCDETTNKKQNQQKKDMYYIEVTCTNRNFFSGMRTIVSNGNTETILDYQPMNYIAKAYGSSKLTSELKTLLDAMYLYGEAAMKI